MVTKKEHKNYGTAANMLLKCVFNAEPPREILQGGQDCFGKAETSLKIEDLRSN